MILEGVVTTLNSSGSLNVAPMGPHFSEGFEKFVVRPYRTSTTYQNLKSSGVGIFHVTDDVLLIARAVIGSTVEPPTRPAERIHGQILLDACRYYEFRVVEELAHESRAGFVVETLASGRLRDFLGFNRAKHAVLEAAIIATRTRLLTADSILTDFKRLKMIVGKTAGPEEFEAFRLLEEYVFQQITSKPSSEDPTGL